MTPTEITQFIAEAEAICEKATPGPWWRENIDDSAHKGKGCQDYIVAQIEPPSEYSDGQEHIVTCDSGYYGPRKHDANFMCYARTALPKALEMLKNLRAKLSVARAAALEEAARICEARGPYVPNQDCADAIRAAAKERP